MDNQILKFSSEEEKILLSEMEMLEVYGGTKASGSSYQVSNGCKCKNCGSGSSSSGSHVISICGDGNKTHAVCTGSGSGSEPSGSTGGN